MNALTHRVPAPVTPPWDRTSTVTVSFDFNGDVTALDRANERFALLSRLFPTLRSDTLERAAFWANDEIEAVAEAADSLTCRMDPAALRATARRFGFVAPAKPGISAMREAVRDGIVTAYASLGAGTVA